TWPARRGRHASVRRRSTRSPGYRSPVAPLLIRRRPAHLGPDHLEVVARELDQPTTELVTPVRVLPCELEHGQQRADGRRDRRMVEVDPPSPGVEVAVLAGHHRPV